MSGGEGDAELLLEGVDRLAFGASSVTRSTQVVVERVDAREYVVDCRHTARGPSSKLPRKR